jgi:hypothetical protein
MYQVKTNSYYHRGQLCKVLCVHKGVIHSILSRLPDDYDTIVTVLNISHELYLGDVLEQLVNQEEELKKELL